MNVFGMLFFPFFGLGFLAYFFPTVLAVLRDRHDKFSIFLVNFFLGWSFIGWIVALVWACKSERVIYVQAPQNYR